VLKDATVYTMRWGPEESDYTDLAVLPDSEYVSEEDFPLNLPDVVEYHKYIGPNNTSDLDDPSKFLFDHIFLDLVGKCLCLLIVRYIFICTKLLHFLFSYIVAGHAKLIDTYLSNPRAGYHDTVVKDKIVFHDENASDPNWMVRQCYLLMIASATEVVHGVENLWKSGPSIGHQEYPDFGQYIPVNYFKAF